MALEALGSNPSIHLRILVIEVIAGIFVINGAFLEMQRKAQ